MKTIASKENHSSNFRQVIGIQAAENFLEKSVLENDGGDTIDLFEFMTYLRDGGK